MILLVGLVLLLSGCVTLKDPEAAQEYTGDVVARLGPGQPVGQTFLSRRARLNEVQLWLRQVQPPSAHGTGITVELFRSPDDPQPVVRLSLPASEVTRNFPVTIKLPPQPDPPNQPYYLRLSASDGAYDLYGRAEDAYPPGALWLNGAAQAADAAFRLSYDYDAAAILSDLWAALRAAWLIVPLLLALWVPGRLLTRLVEDQLKLDWGQRTALSTGLSLAVVPVALLWTSLIGLHWSRAAVFSVYLLLTGLLIGLGLRAGRQVGSFKRAWPRCDLLDLGLLAVFLLSLGARLAMVRDLAAPAWIDSVHHSLITRLILEQGAFPADFAPYVPASAVGYHLGFHSTTAVFTWLSGLELPEAMLLFGQILNALSVFFVYLLTLTFTRDRLAGLVAALLVGLFSPMPAYYTSWGRYTQLAGLIVLPVCMCLVQASLGSPKWPWRITLVGGLACAGLFLIHYRVIIFFAALLIAYGLAEIIRQLDKHPLWRTLPHLAVRVGVIGSVAILLAWPQVGQVFTALLAPHLAGGLPEPQPLTSISWGYLTPAYGRAVLILGLVGVVWSILRARWVGPLLALWAGLLYMSANQGVVRLPTAGGINLTSVEIILFLPLTLLGGWLIADLARLIGQALPTQLRRPYWALFAAAGLVWALLGAQRLLPILNPTTFLFRQADRPAMTWVSQNVPAGETLLINPFLWGYGYYAGQDGGYYLAPFAGRNSLPPPVLYGMGKTDYVDRINKISRQVLDLGKNPAGLHDLMAAEGLHYIYLGRRGGAISPQALRQSDLFELLYAQDGVYVFKTR